jgi:PAS domain-containing protein
VSEGKPLEMEFRIRSRNRHSRWFRGRSVPIGEHAGAVMNWYRFWTDIDDLTRALGKREG